MWLVDEPNSNSGRTAQQASWLRSYLAKRLNNEQYNQTNEATIQLTKCNNYA